MAHMVYESRMQSHLVKCERSHPVDKLVCPFNSTHRLDCNEYVPHVNTCTSRCVIEGQKYKLQDRIHFELPPYVEPILPPSEDNWDDEPPSLPYDPQQYAESACVLRKPAGVTKSERKAFYLRERERLSRIQGVQGGEASGSATGMMAFYGEASASTAGMEGVHSESPGSTTGMMAFYGEAATSIAGMEAVHNVYSGSASRMMAFYGDISSCMAGVKTVHEGLPSTTGMGAVHREASTCREGMVASRGEGLITPIIASNNKKFYLHPAMGLGRGRITLSATPVNFLSMDVISNIQHTSPITESNQRLESVPGVGHILKEIPGILRTMGTVSGLFQQLSQCLPETSHTM